MAIDPECVEDSLQPCTLNSTNKESNDEPYRSKTFDEVLIYATSWMS